MRSYSVNKLAKLAGVSVRTLHYYDRLGLLKPSVRTEARYRLYGEKELYRLQQILFFRELDFSLADIRQLLDDPDFDQLAALKAHKHALQARRERLSALLITIDKTMLTLTGESIMLTDEELYAGFPPGEAEKYRQEAISAYGTAEVEASEASLRQLSQADLNRLKAELEAVSKALFSKQQQAPASPDVQSLIARHYALIRQFWGEAVCRNKNMAEAYAGLGQLYVDDPRFTRHDGLAQPAFAAFMQQAMAHFAETTLRGGY
ncbi:MerR family transcriptional regulator [Arsenicibacter rosenii]|uniref:MerR family transcriptional regulator n=1 Tax=Arsenicibacter rosenii TaxID=1750698 RepID=A0A1S2VP26_9BACT|nr:MerR family transcriptional regulator [Arsenicibacter rosenii]OIN59538.1 MerR family transcriptional regulator [Arsenicibacter rosenii]